MDEVPPESKPGRHVERDGTGREPGVVVVDHEGRLPAARAHPVERVPSVAE